MKKKKKLLMITWRDIRSPFAGGAETLTHGILKKLKKDYEITVWSSAYPNCKRFEKIDGIQYVRMGSKRFNFIGPYNWRVYFTVFRYYWFTNKRKIDFDIVIEQINNIPFLFSLYGKKNTIIHINQLCRENWFFQVPWPLSLIGYYVFEPVYLWLLRTKKVITISQSTKKDLIKFGFKKENIFVIPIGINLSPVKTLATIKKFSDFSLLSLGNIREMKRTYDQIKAFEIAKVKIPRLKLYISGSPGGSYAARIFDHIHKSPYKKDIIYLGYIPPNKKKWLMQKCHYLLMTSIKEGWGLVVTEAASQGTPAIIYNVDGLRDSVKDETTGIICRKNQVENLAENIFRLYKDRKLYRKLQKNGWLWTKNLTFDASAEEYSRIII